MKEKIQNYVCYRMPEETHYTLMVQTDGAPEVVADVRSLGTREGFVMAPFVATERHPILLLRPDVVERHEVEPAEVVWTADGESTADQEAYARDFARFHGEVAAGRYGKLVLSRRLTVPMAGEPDAQALFLRACRLYPHQFIALVSMLGAGTWLMATPEVLLEGRGLEWRTMALAGTMKGTGSKGEVTTGWSEKNMAEQRYVSAYITDILQTYASEATVKGPYTTMAAHLFHLRTDFAFRLDDRQRLGDLLDALFPTPAVCGIPKDAARQFIIGHESVDRKYYSGFCGPLSLGGASHLFVSLRCMEICADHFDLYAGGGILRDSETESEWRETETKMQTMLRLLNP